MDPVPFAVWSAIAAAIMVSTSLSYRAYLRRRRHEGGSRGVGASRP